MARLDLRAAAVQEAIDPAALPALDDRERRLALATWRGRMLNEHVSAQVFAGLVPQMMRAEVDPRLQAELADMIADELRHARKCAGVVLGLGGEPVIEMPALAAFPEHAGASPREALLFNLLSVSCLSETVAVALIDAERLELGDSVLARVLREILADEVGHARLGWRVLEAEPLDEALRERLSAYLALAFAHLEAHELAAIPPTPAPSAACARAGVCDGRFARALFYETVEQVIVPRLEEHGLAAREAWRRRAA